MFKAKERDIYGRKIKMRLRKKGTPSIRQVVVFFYRENDNKVHRLNDRWERRPRWTTPTVPGEPGRPNRPTRFS
jgi:hypothetical protein